MLFRYSHVVSEMGCIHKLVNLGAVRFAVLSQWVCGQELYQV